MARECCRRGVGRHSANAEIHSLVRVDEQAAVRGSIRLTGAEIGGTLALHGQLSEPDNASPVGGSGITAADDVYPDGLRATGGAVTFRRATLGSLSAAGTGVA